MSLRTTGWSPNLFVSYKNFLHYSIETPLFFACHFTAQLQTCICPAQFISLNFFGGNAICPLAFLSPLCTPSVFQCNLSLFQIQITHSIFEPQIFLRGAYTPLLHLPFITFTLRTLHKSNPLFQDCMQSTLFHWEKYHIFHVTISTMFKIALCFYCYSISFPILHS